MFGRKLKFLFLSLICFLSFSCSFYVMNPGNINYNLPSSREAGNGETITYRVTLQNMGGRIFYDKFLTDTQIKINNIPVGRYYIAIKGHDSQYNYFGDQHFTVEYGKKIPIDINLIKTPINIENGNGDGGAGNEEDIPQPEPPVIDEAARVTFNKLKDAINKANNYDTVKLTKDIIMIEQIEINKNISIISDSPVTLTRASGNTGEMFKVKTGVTFTLGDTNKSQNEIILDGGSVANAGSLIYIPETSRVNLYKCTLQNNLESKHGGGAIYNCGVLIADTSTIKNNKSTGAGGAVYIGDPGDATLKNVTITGNTAKTTGGGISITGKTASEVSLTGSSVCENNTSTASLGNNLYVSSGPNFNGSTSQQEAKIDSKVDSTTKLN